ncbi:hypothetical protein J6590_086569 [Homalodisca vitripennis]|nr:hypothetical protein J6590_086569 [Homalodisca vitripennis]
MRWYNARFGHTARITYFGGIGPVQFREVLYGCENVYYGLHPWRYTSLSAIFLPWFYNAARIHAYIFNYAVEIKLHKEQLFPKQNHRQPVLRATSRPRHDPSADVSIYGKLHNDQLFPKQDTPSTRTPRYVTAAPRPMSAYTAFTQRSAVP